MLYGAKTWAMTWKKEVILKDCDRRMHKYMTRGEMRSLLCDVQ